jgi:uncharacterized protein YndB with AHSA1/START domain
MARSRYARTSAVSRAASAARRRSARLVLIVRKISRPWHEEVSMALENPPIARATMLIRRPVEEVFHAFIDPAITTRFWFSRSSGRLTAGKTVTWYWDHYGISGHVFVRALERNRRIEIEWPTPVEWLFTPRSDGATFVSSQLLASPEPMMRRWRKHWVQRKGSILSLAHAKRNGDANRR